MVFLQINFIQGQILDKKYIDDWVLRTFPESVIDSNFTFYIVNGIRFEFKTVNSKLNKYKQSDLNEIDYINKLFADSSLNDSRTSIVLISIKENQTRKSIKYDFDKVKQRFNKKNLVIIANIDSSLKEPILLVNGIQIPQTDCFAKIDSIKISDIKGIYIIDRPVSSKTYGPNALNGMIIIKTKK